MIEIMQGLPDNVIGINASGNVSKDDYQNVLIPALKEAIEKHDKIKIYYQFGENFIGMDFGAMWEDMWFGLGNINHWERIAVVTNVEWIKNSIGIFRFIVPCPIKVFTNTESTAALSWINASKS